MNKETFDFIAFIAWIEQIVDFFSNLLSKLGGFGGAAKDETE